MVIVGLTNEVTLLRQLSYSHDASGPELAFKDGDTFSMEQNDGVYEEGQTIFEIDEIDRDLLEGAESDAL